MENLLIHVIPRDGARVGHWMLLRIYLKRIGVVDPVDGKHRQEEARFSSSLQGASYEQPILFDKRKHLAEMWMLGCCKPLEYDHLSCCNFSAVTCHALNRGLLAFGPARAERVSHHKHTPACVPKAEHRLKHADMG